MIAKSLKEERREGERGRETEGNFKLNQTQKSVIENLLDLS